MTEASHTIPGIYNYCDRWCERCRFADRCFVFRSQTSQLPPDSAELAILAETYRVPPEMPVEDLGAEITRQLSRLDGDPLKHLAESYTFAACPVIQALDPILRARQDDVAIAALETLRHHVILISSKTVRALHGFHTYEYNRADRQCDAHGSAKVARLAIKESREAWDVLTQVGRAAADGVPRKMIEKLTELDATLADRFPMAMAFVREGFDTE